MKIIKFSIADRFFFLENLIFVLSPVFIVGILIKGVSLLTVTPIFLISIYGYWKHYKNYNLYKSVFNFLRTLYIITFANTASFALTFITPNKSELQLAIGLYITLPLYLFTLIYMVKGKVFKEACKFYTDEYENNYYKPKARL